ncbi:MAG TPA: response regulator transcription factor [Chitinophagaceae bacterium]
MKQKGFILVLDDDPDICMMIKMVLDYYGYEVMDSANEEAAKEIISSNRVDLIIMDMLLSGADGTDICKQLKKSEATSSIPVLMFSAHPTARETCLAAGADDFISKPFEMNDMMDKISFFLSRNKIAQE